METSVISPSFKGFYYILSHKTLPGADLANEASARKPNPFHFLITFHENPFGPL